jgi:cellulose synthase (UDP-forming)
MRGPLLRARHLSRTNRRRRAAPAQIHKRTIQSFFIPSNPLTIPGLTFFQRIAHFEGISHWFTSIYRAIFLILPPFLIFMQIVPVRTSTEEWIYFFIPFYCVQLSTLGWVSFRSHSAFFGDVYQVISCLPLSIAIIKTLVSPFAARFRVTPKGISQRFFSYNWRLALPLFFVLVLTLGAYLKTVLFPIRCGSQNCLAHQSNIAGIELIIAFFAMYNLLVLSIAIVGLIEVPKVSVAEIGYGIATPVILQVGEQNYRGMTRQLSERWAEIDLETGLENELSLTGSLINTVFSEENLCLGGIIQQSVNYKQGTLLRIEWEPMAIAQYRRLVEIIFCKPGRWQQKANPGELKTIALLVSHLFYPLRLLAQSRRPLGSVSPKKGAS